ncbi:hypothetical protein RHGRI_006371 [Rhododendron griersonianum]|uniref:Aminotransferase-like plant mobile domain-containing protein n=1 Tax=Rhododendron griersonianum TaxID=479676 RepID=A0AAV6KSU5_9ERIC|nr:hypothetical protein RHGRI_006371 [Rhododendron griersonianum]
MKDNDNRKKKIEKTIFGPFLNLYKVRISDKLLRSLVFAWDQTQSGFKTTTGKVVKFKLEQVERILYFPSKGDDITLYDDKNKLINHGNSGIDTLVHGSFLCASDLSEKLLADEVTDDKQYTRMYIACLFASYLFPIASKKGSIGSHLFGFLKDLKKVKNYRWGKAIYDFLVQSITAAAQKLEKYSKKFGGKQEEFYVNGCTAILQIWAMQHLDVKTSSTIPLIWIPKKISLSKVEIEKIQESFPAGDTLVDPPTESHIVVSMKGSKDWLQKHLFYTPTVEENEEIDFGIEHVYKGELREGQDLVDDYIDILRDYMPRCHFFSTLEVGNILSGVSERLYDIKPNHKKAMLVHKQNEQNASNEGEVKFPDNIPKQENSHDCAVYMIAFMVSLAVSDKIPSFDKNQVCQMRRRIFLELKKKMLLPEYPEVGYKHLYERKCRDYEILQKKYETLVSKYKGSKSNEGESTEVCRVRNDLFSHHKVVSYPLEEDTIQVSHEDKDNLGTHDFEGRVIVFSDEGTDFESRELVGQITETVAAKSLLQSSTSKLAPGHSNRLFDGRKNSF